MFQESYLSINPQHPLRRAGKEMHQTGGDGCQGREGIDHRAGATAIGAVGRDSRHSI